MKLPRISLGGTNGDDLLESYGVAYHAALEALGKLAQNACPNGRDYASWDDFLAAKDQHEERMKRIESVVLELDQIRDSICTQTLERKL